jgi:peptidoglycan/xylan/chitin deacetylase (PgdA/CDA1 family)
MSFTMAAAVAQLLFSSLAAAGWSVPILLYHRFGAAAEMTVPTATFEEHLATLKARGYTVIPLRRLVDAYYGRAPAPPPRSVVLVADDAHRSVFTDMLPLVRRYGVPVTLFVYPSAVSNASYAMTWDELRALRGTGLFDFQSHTYWHPNFKREKRKLPAVQYAKLADEQLRKPRAKLERELGTRPDFLAWPFGIWDDDLLRRATAAGYAATFTIVRRPATSEDSPLKLPRYLLTAADRGKAFARILEAAEGAPSGTAASAARPAAPSRL